jgi:uncharacterized protein YbcI
LDLGDEPVLYRVLEGAAGLLDDGVSLELDQGLLDVGVDAAHDARKQFVAHELALGGRRSAVVKALVQRDHRRGHGLEHRRTMADSTARQRNGAARTAISDGMVALLKDYYGVGPTQTKTYYRDDLVVCLMRGEFTRVEQTRLEGGRIAAVIQQRMEFQEVVRNRLIAVVEEAMGRPVVGFLSGNQQDLDMICEVFVLAPTGLVMREEVPTRPTGGA